MSYAGISIREALDKLNAPNNGWCLPQVQRQYVWGARHESETYICLLLDSLLRRYPIGGIVLWETNQKVPYRYFIGDYTPGKYAKQVDEGLWGAHKFLVYDGQQRLQTLYSVLRHRFNGQVLHFDLLFDSERSEADETGFLFRSVDAAPDPQYLRMTELSVLTCKDEEKISLEDRALPAAMDGKKETALRIRKNLNALWNIFVETNHKSIAYFSVSAQTPKEVNEVFRRLNTGGVALTQLELVLGKIKAIHSDYEEGLWALTDQIKQKSGGIKFSSTSVLQFFHVLVKGTLRIDEERLEAADILKFEKVLKEDTAPLMELFGGYLKGLLNINNASIVPRMQAVLPIAAYLTVRKRKGFEWRIRGLRSGDLQLIHQYFLLSQFCDWNTQTMVTAFAREAMAAAEMGDTFPLERIREIAIQKNRTAQVHEYQLLSQPWLATKVTMPHRSYVFHENKPQVDHIFPLHLKGCDEAYERAVDVLWNFQPMPAEVNNYKRARHPKEFFKSNDGCKYWASYDFIPKADSPLWDNHFDFIRLRRTDMIDALSRLYGLSLAEPAVVQEPHGPDTTEPQMEIFT
ncbi:MAG TPA: DUF262 domain-containing protein [Candidimonas sp.]|nr:DUF262 domain-containing protein [Candidimonas sp.]